MSESNGSDLPVRPVPFREAFVSFRDEFRASLERAILQSFAVTDAGAPVALPDADEPHIIDERTEMNPAEWQRITDRLGRKPR